MTESTPFHPTSVKGFIRAGLDDMLIREMNAGSLKVIIAKSADFYGPRAVKTSVAGILVFDKMKKGKTAQWLSSADQPHSYTYTPDAAKALYMLAMDDTAYGQSWHLPTAKPALTGKEFVAIAAKYMKARNRVRILPSSLVRFIGLFDPIMKELGEMLYQNEFPYIFDSSKFEKAFQFKPTGYEEGLRQTAEWWLAS
jgi:nucleoside-diphosphate-sugar epimerase